MSTFAILRNPLNYVLVKIETTSLRIQYVLQNSPIKLSRWIKTAYVFKINPFCELEKKGREIANSGSLLSKAFTPVSHTFLSSSV